MGCTSSSTGATAQPQSISPASVQTHPIDKPKEKPQESVPINEKPIENESVQPPLPPQEQEMVEESNPEPSSSPSQKKERHIIIEEQTQIENLPKPPDSNLTTPMNADSILESPTSTLGDIPTFENLRTLRDAHNAYAGESMDDHKLQALFTVFDEDEEKEVEISRSLFIRAQEASKALPPGAASSSSQSFHEPNSPKPIENKPRKPSPAGIIRRKVATPLTPKPTLTPNAMRATGSLDDFADEDEEAINPPKSSSSRPAGQFITPSLRHVEVSSSKHSSLRSLNANISPTHSAGDSPVPPTKRGFLTQVAELSPMASPKAGGAVSPRAYHVLDEGVLYQIDSISRTPPFSIDNKAIVLKNASLIVQDKVIGVSDGRGSRVSFEVRDEGEREGWLEALRQHIEFSEGTGKSVPE